ncbi:MAG TPA: cytochrome c biogenesis protein CcsA [Thermoanaerobaculia bacterium]|nr:cytochrome c biogenesis protein CcsA [Thermoanaerobaculia bacterium]
MENSPAATRRRPALPALTLALAALLWLWMAAAIWAAFAWAPPARGFQNVVSSRILFFHVPIAWGSFVAFLAAGVWSLLFLARGRRPRHDLAAAVAVELGLVFCLLATLSGAIWSRLEWGAFWNWDPRQTSIVLALVFYAAYLALRGAVDDAETRRRLSAAYAALGLVVAPFLFFVLPRLTFSLHPEPVINAEGDVAMDSRILIVLVTASTGFTALFFWVHNLAWRLRRAGEER